MAHFAQIDSSNTVLQVIVVNNDVIDNLPFPESEAPGIEFCQSLFGPDTFWVQTSYNGSFRYNYAGTGYTFDAAAQPSGAFIPPCIGVNWTLDTTTYQWVKNPTSDNPPPTVL